MSTPELKSLALEVYKQVKDEIKTDRKGTITIGDVNIVITVVNKVNGSTLKSTEAINELTKNLIELAKKPGEETLELGKLATGISNMALAQELKFKTLVELKLAGKAMRGIKTGPWETLKSYLSSALINLGFGQKSATRIEEAKTPEEKNTVLEQVKAENPGNENVIDALKDAQSTEEVEKAVAELTKLWGPHTAIIDQKGKLVFSGRPEEVQQIRIQNLEDLEKIPDSIFQFTHATELILSNCGVKELPAKLSKLTHLERLDLRSNQLTNISAISNLTELKFLNLQGNKLTRPPNVGRLTRLTELDLRGNPELTHLPVLTNCKELGRLYIDENLYVKEGKNLVRPSDTKKLLMGIRQSTGVTAWVDVYPSKT